MSVVLACDLGGTSFRAALIDDRGAVLALQAVPAPATDERGGRCEIDPEAWWRALLDATTALAEAAPVAFAATVGIAICGVTRSQVLLGPDGRPTRPAITWRDTRAASRIAALQAALPADHPEHPGLNAFHPLARLAWLRDDEPETLPAGTVVLDPKDYLNACLTGRAVSDTVSMARLAASAAPGPGGMDLLAASGLDRGLLPVLLDPCAPVGAVRPGLPAPLDRLAGRPVFCAANDTWAAVAGLGAMRPGSAYNISGTTEVFGLVLDARAEAAGLMSVDWGGVHQLGGPGQNGADTAAWLLACLAPDAAGAVGPAFETLLAAARDPQPLLFLPYLQGERVPYWDAALRGAFVGLNRNHRATDLAWALLEGIAFLNRTVLARAEAATGIRAREIRFGGGAARNPAWCQVKADICERPVVVGAAEEPGLLGAAIVAWTGLGRFADLANAQDALVAAARRYEPRPDRAAAYRRLAALYAQAETALAPISHALVALGGEATGLPGIRPDTARP